MANLEYKAPDTTIRRRKARGAGTDGDPFVTEQDANIQHNGAPVSTSNRLPVDPGAVATETTAQAIRNRLPAAFGRQAQGAGLPVTLSTEDAALLTAVRDGIGAADAPEAPADGPLIGILKRIRTLIADLATKTLAEQTVNSLGTDGSSPPTIAGTGVRGWLRALVEGQGSDGPSAPGISGTGVRGWLRAAYELLAGVNTNLGTPSDSEATGNGSAIAILKRLRTLLLGRGKLVQAKLAPVASTTVAYTAGDALGGVQFFDNLALEAGDGLLAVSAKAVVVPAGFAFDLIIFDAAPTVSPVDNEPYNIAFAAHPNVAAWYVFDGSTTYERVLDGTNTNTRAQKPNPTLSSDPNEVIIPSTGRGLWFVAIARTTQSTPFSNVGDIIATVSFSRA